MRRASPGELASQPGERLNFGANVFWLEVGVFKMAPSRMRRMILFAWIVIRTYAASWAAIPLYALQKEEYRSLSGSFRAEEKFVL